MFQLLKAITPKMRLEIFKTVLLLKIYSRITVQEFMAAVAQVVPAVLAAQVEVLAAEAAALSVRLRI